MSGREWSELVGRALPGKGVPGAVRLSVRPGEVSALVGGQEVSLIRAVPGEADWERVCAALASQPLFGSRVLAGELPVAVAEVFALLGVDLVPRGWDSLVATCSCDRWEGVCVHLAAAAAALADEAERDPFVLTRWLGRERRALQAQVRTLGAINIPTMPEETTGNNSSGTAMEEDSSVSSGTETPAEPGSAAAFWSAPALPAPPVLPRSAGERIRAAAPGALADELPRFSEPGT
ncbi:hypothetical protein [Nocardiopsis algeriensis]|uniref:Putative Zn finger protein n=1 Tax=Nocardiopsis algeriensis TaxID=1478215 RepID=A0A841IUK4_9ACTN|nr:hypothetical protein [Nocardiopsis algeriensis]MBB6119848.1 putative Zn finger protein [Nocardiopsis algeriensis]